MAMATRIARTITMRFSQSIRRRRPRSTATDGCRHRLTSPSARAITTAGTSVLENGRRSTWPSARAGSGNGTGVTDKRLPHPVHHYRGVRRTAIKVLEPQYPEDEAWLHWSLWSDRRCCAKHARARAASRRHLNSSHQTQPNQLVPIVDDDHPARSDRRPLGSGRVARLRSRAS
jgi:hypothetical protein